MKKSILFTFVLCLLSQWSVAQAPKWVEKAKRSVFSIVTYDKDDKIQNTGNGFFVTEDGVALSDYSLFKGAQRAVVVLCVVVFFWGCCSFCGGGARGGVGGPAAEGVTLL